MIRRYVAVQFILVLSGKSGSGTQEKCSGVDPINFGKIESNWQNLVHVVHTLSDKDGRFSHLVLVSPDTDFNDRLLTILVDAGEQVGPWVSTDLIPRLGLDASKDSRFPCPTAVLRENVDPKIRKPPMKLMLL